MIYNMGGILFNATPVERALAAIMHCFEPIENDLAIRLGALQLGREVRVRVAALAPPVDSRFAYHGTGWEGLVGIPRAGFRYSPAYPERRISPLVYVSPEVVVGWRHPMHLRTCGRDLCAQHRLCRSRC